MIDHRDVLGELVRDVWVAWAREQPNPKPSWLVPWDELDEASKEVDRRIGEALERFLRADVEARVLGAIEELSIGVEWPRLSYVVRTPAGDERLAVQPETVEDIFRALRAHYHRLGDWSELREQRHQQARLRRENDELRSRLRENGGSDAVEEDAREG